MPVVRLQHDDRVVFKIMRGFNHLIGFFGNAVFLGLPLAVDVAQARGEFIGVVL